MKPLATTFGTAFVFALLAGATAGLAAGEPGQGTGVSGAAKVAQEIGSQATPRDQDGQGQMTGHHRGGMMKHGDDRGMTARGDDRGGMMKHHRDGGMTARGDDRGGMMMHGDDRGMTARGDDRGMMMHRRDGGMMSGGKGTSMMHRGGKTGPSMGADSGMAPGAAGPDGQPMTEHMRSMNEDGHMGTDMKQHLEAMAEHMKGMNGPGKDESRRAN